MKVQDFNNLSITQETTGKLPSLPFLDMKNSILGKKYELSLVFMNKKHAIEMHKEWKSKNDPVNILSFPLSKNEGEILVSLDKAKTECKKFGQTYENYVGFLFIHGCVHLKGFSHGSKMETVEKKFRKKFKIAS